MVVSCLVSTDRNQASIATNVQIATIEMKLHSLSIKAFSGSSLSGLLCWIFKNDVQLRILQDNLYWDIVVSWRRVHLILYCKTALRDPSETSVLGCAMYSHLILPYICGVSSHLALSDIMGNPV